MLTDSKYPDFFTGLEQSLPAIFDRETASSCLGGLISPKTFANLDSLGKGPSWSIRVGKKIAYEKVSFLEWIKSRIKLAYLSCFRFLAESGYNIYEFIKTPNWCG